MRVTTDNCSRFTKLTEIKLTHTHTQMHSCRAENIINALIQMVGIYILRYIEYKLQIEISNMRFYSVQSIFIHFHCPNPLFLFTLFRRLSSAIFFLSCVFFFLLWWHKADTQTIFFCLRRLCTPKEMSNTSSRRRIIHNNQLLPIIVVDRTG